MVQDVADLEVSTCAPSDPRYTRHTSTGRNQCSSPEVSDHLINILGYRRHLGLANLGPAFSRILPCHLSYLTADHGPTRVTLVNGPEYSKHVVESASHVGLQEVFLM